MASDLLSRSASFPVALPTTDNNISNFDPAVIEDHATKTRVVVHDRLFPLISEFLTHKRAHGSKYEKQLYSYDFDAQQMIARLIEKRPFTFMGRSDSTFTRSEVDFFDGRQEWDRVGTELQHMNKFLSLAEYLSYDEIMLGSLIGVSGPTHFINTGSRYNRGQNGLPGQYQPTGIIIGLVGARFERSDVMDSIHVLSGTSPKQDAELSAIFQQHFGVTKSNAQFNIDMYKARMRITIDTLLLEANERAIEAGKTAYVHVVGLGLGVWQVRSEQPLWYIEEFTSALQELELPHISTLEFGWIDGGSAQAGCEEAGKRASKKILFNRRDPAAILDTEELLVVSYAWDGNAFPGNEYWVGSLAGSGDPAAACFSTIAQLHNPMVNLFTSRIKKLGERGPSPGSNTQQQ